MKQILKLFHIIEYELLRDNSPTNAFRRCLTKLIGTWGICALFLEHDVMVCARNGSPLIIGQGEGEMFVSKDYALANHTQKNMVHIARYSTAKEVLQEDWQNCS